jgi:hypothetical protein
MSEVLGRYTLEIIGYPNPDGSSPQVELLPGFIRETEENLEQLLNGAYVRYPTVSQHLWVRIEREDPHV